MRKVLHVNDHNEFEIREEVAPKKPHEKVQNFSFKIFAVEVGLTISLPLITGAVLGSVLDKKFNTAPKLTLILIFGGMVLGFVNLMRIVQKNLK